MAKAVTVVTGSFPEQNQIRVAVSTGVTGDVRGFLSEVLVDFAKSTVQITNDIKAKVAQDVQAQGGPALAVGDILLFGGPS